MKLRPGAIEIYPSAQADGLQITFDEAHESTPTGADLQQSQTNYLIGDDPSQWRTHVSNYAKVIYPSLYPGVDAIFYGNGNHLEHDFIVKAGADYRQIRMHFPAGSHVRSQSGRKRAEGPAAP